MTISQRLREIADNLATSLAPGYAPQVASIAAELEPVPAADAVPWSGEFIRATNDSYIAWCATHYQPESLDERGMMSLHGLWAWQEQERRTRATVAALQARIKALEAENFSLAAGQCIVPGGLCGDEGGSQYCSLQRAARNAPPSP